MPKRKTTKKKAPARRAKSAARRASSPTAKKKGTKKGPSTGLLDAVAAVLRKAREPMSCPELVEAVLRAGTWKTRGKTPAATLSAAIHREIRDKGKEARFAKAERGRFRLRAARVGNVRKSA